jgi:hypothetical protein
LQPWETSVSRSSFIKKFDKLMKKNVDKKAILIDTITNKATSKV